MFWKREKEEITSLRLVVRQLESKVDTLEKQLAEARYRVIATSREDIIEKLEKLLDRLKEDGRTLLNESLKSGRPTSHGRNRLLEMQETIEAALEVLWRETRPDNPTMNPYLPNTNPYLSSLQNLGGVSQFR